MSKWTPTKWRPPRTGETPLRVMFRNGRISDHTYTAKQLNWSDRDYDFDIVAVRREKQE